MYASSLMTGTRRDLNTCNSQSAMHHGVRVRVFSRRSTTAETTAAAHLGLLVLLPSPQVYIFLKLLLRESGKKQKTVARLISV